MAVNLRTSLRRGAWYAVHSAGPEEVVLEVRGKSTIVPRGWVDVADEKPRAWTLVPADWGGPYIVCPNCAKRVWIREPIHALQCDACHAGFPLEAL